MFKKILIANRGEIAIRVIRACRELGIISVAVYSDADRNSLHVALADEAVHIGPTPSKDSYLSIPKIIEACKATRAEAVHPGYGFLSENEDFARALKKEGIVFIGPTPENIEAMGDKLSARKRMAEAGVPIVPGSPGAIKTEEEAKEVAAKIGFPIIIKASAGGGGKGMRIVEKLEDVASALRAAKSEGMNYFKDDTVYIERYISSPKHIEVQIFGDTHGNVVHLFERECSIQRRHQKVIEECPSPSVPEHVRNRMGEISVKAAKAIGYIGAGTFEFIFDNNTKEFFFMEMNTRLQVEHPVTEMVTGVDLVREQIFVALGRPLSFKQTDLKQTGHAIECRICAEDPVTFMPSPGKIRKCRNPQGPFIRVDGAAYPGGTVPMDYDPMIAKVIAWGHTRQQAIERMRRALAETSMTGIKTNIVLHRSILQHPTFLDGHYTTQFVEKEISVNVNPDIFKFVSDEIFLIAAAITAYNDRKSKDTSRLKVTTRWRDLARLKSLR